MTKFRLDLFIICVVAAVLLGLIGFKWPDVATYVGVLCGAGAIPYLLINGAHGDMGGVGGVIGGILFVLVNAGVYYVVVQMILERTRAGRTTISMPPPSYGVRPPAWRTPMSHDPKKCAHTPCSCTVTEGKYCSPFCEDPAAAMSSAIGCDCPHAGCGGKL